MWVLILIVILFLICKPSKKAQKTKPQKRTSSSKTPQKYKDMIRKQRDMSRLTPEGELPVGWVTVYEDFIEEAEAELHYFYNEYYAHQHGDVMKKYAALKSLVLYFEDAKKIYAKKGECFLYWFENWWAKEDEVQRFKDELEYMETHIDELLQQEKTLKKLRTDLKKIIQDEPGVKQEQLYKRFSPDLKSHISNELYHMAAKGIIRREKSGRSYELYVK